MLRSSDELVFNSEHPPKNLPDVGGRRAAWCSGSHTGGSQAVPHRGAANGLCPPN